jgi:DNA-binding PadR family transcriptional regulator
MIRDLFLGFVKLHILYHASKEPVFGLDIIRELARHGYHLSPGTLYPILHDLDAKGYLSSSREVVSGKVRKYYRATDQGCKALEEAVVQARELLNELQE